MQRRTLDILFSIGGLALAALLLIAGLVLTSNANFAKDYVHDQLSEQKIVFTEAKFLTPEEKKAECILDNAGKQLTTGKQAECYANEYIGLHLSEIADGKTYAELGGPQRELQAQVEELAPTDPSLPALQGKLDEITDQRDTLFKGEALRGLLLTSYGFSVFGVKGGEIATVCFIVAGLLFILSIAGFVHAFRTSKSKAVGAPESA